MEQIPSTLVIVYSYHHHNTEKVAGAIAHALGAQIKHPGELQLEDIAKYGLVGFGAGIDSGRHYTPLLALANALPAVQGTKAFIFSTSGIYSESKMLKDHKALRDILISKGFGIAGEFSCAGFNTNSILKAFGGMNKGKPNANDLERATRFAMKLAKHTDLVSGIE